MRFKALRHQPSDAARKSGYNNEGQLPDTLPDSRSRPGADVGEWPRSASSNHLDPRDVTTRLTYSKPLQSIGSHLAYSEISAPSTTAMSD